MAKFEVSIRMYKIGELGDCFFLKFSSGDDCSHVLIDCGSYWNREEGKKRLQKIAKNIKETLRENELDLIIATHQHNDHMSGFIHAKETFDEIKVNQVMLSWLDDPTSEESITIQNKHKKIAESLHGFRKRIGDNPQSFLNQLTDLALGDDESSLTDQATEYLRSKGISPIIYASPGESYNMPGNIGSKVRLHILGPPKDYSFLKDTSPKKRETYDPHLTSLLLRTAALDRRFNEENQEDSSFPFHPSHNCKEGKLPKHIKDELKLNNWRNIDEDWVYMAENLALHLNSITNNTSLVVAIEIIESGKFLLFVGDAQTGNWNSWPHVNWKDKKMTLQRILDNTIFYKVGHHASHNATQPEIFDRISTENLIAMIPVDKEDPNIKNREKPWRMPASNLYNTLDKATKGRVLRMDNDQNDIDQELDWSHEPIITDLYVEVTL